MKCPVCNASVDDGGDEAREVVGELLSALACVLKHFGVKEDECFTLPNGDCIGTKCMHRGEE